MEEPFVCEPGTVKQVPRARLSPSTASRQPPPWADDGGVDSA